MSLVVREEKNEASLVGVSVLSSTSAFVVNQQNDHGHPANLNLCFLFLKVKVMEENRWKLTNIVSTKKWLL